MLHTSNKIIKHDIFKTIICFAYGTIGCFYLHQLAPLSVVLASVVTILSFCLWMYFFSINTNVLEGPTYSGTFVGMSASGILNNFLALFVASVLGGVIIYLLKNKFLGHGGKLGAIAFIAVLIVRAVSGDWL